MEENLEFVIMDLLIKSQFENIRQLENICQKHDKTALKLELDYKESLSKEANVFDQESVIGEEATGGHRNDFLCYVEDQLIAYVGICGFGGNVLEVNGMVHPDFRLMGVFSRLMDFVMTEYNRRMENKLLFLCDSDSEAGQSFLTNRRAVYKFSEYEMTLNMEKAMKLKMNKHLTFRKADNNDGENIAKQNAIYFDLPIEEVDVPLPEVEAARGMDIYLIYEAGQLVGKVNIYLKGGQAGIYGLGILPHARGKGFGRGGLEFAIIKALEKGADEVILQVEAENSNALALYLNSGFEIKSKMDYFDGSQCH